MLPLLQFYKALCLLQLPFSYASANFFFKGIIRDTLTTFNFPMSFFQISFVFFLYFYLWLYLLSIFGFERFCFFMRVQTSFVGGILVVMLQEVSRIFPGLGTSH